MKEFSVCLGMWKSDVICLCTGEHRGLLGTISFGASFSLREHGATQNDIQLPKAVESQWHRNSKVSWGRKTLQDLRFFAMIHPRAHILGPYDAMNDSTREVTS